MRASVRQSLGAADTFRADYDVTRAMAACSARRASVSQAVRNSVNLPGDKAAEMADANGG